MGRSLLAGLLLVVLFLGLALAIVTFGIMPALSNLVPGPTPRPVVVTLLPGLSGLEAAQETPRPLGTAVVTADQTPEEVAPTKTPDSAVIAQANSALEKMLQNLAGGLRYRFTTVGTYTLEPVRGPAKQIAIRVDGEVDGDNVRQVFRTDQELPDNRLAQFEARVVDGVTYMYSNGKWQVTSGAPSGAQEQFFREPVDLEESSVQLEFLDTESLAEAPAPLYRYRINIPQGQMALIPSPADAPTGSVSSVEARQGGLIWLGADGRRYRLEYNIRIQVPQGILMTGQQFQI